MVGTEMNPKRIATMFFALAALLAIGSPPATPAAEAATGPITHVIVVAFENHNRGAVIGTPSAPYLSSLASTYGEATNYQNLTHPSLPNYLAVTGGTTAGITSDCAPSSTCQSSAATIFTQTPWRAYMESMPSPCQKTNSGHYAAHHNPPAYYTRLIGCTSWDVPLPASPDWSKPFTWVTPNGCHNMHPNTCTGSNDPVKQGDNWAASFIPKILATPQYQAGNTAIILWWDENTTSGAALPFIVVSPYTHNVSYPTVINHYDVLYTIEQILGKSCIAASCNQTNFAAAFGL